MNYLIIGNIIALIGSLLMVYSGLIKNKKKLIYIQTIQIGLFVLSNLILGGITGAITNIISLIRNILCYKEKLNIKSKLFIIILNTALCLYFNNQGIIGLFPLCSIIIYTLLMNTKNIIKFKLLIISITIFWLIYDLYIKSYSSAIFDLLCALANFIAIFQITLKNKKQLTN